MKLMMTFMKTVKEDPMNVGPLRDQMLAALGYDLATSVFSIEVVKGFKKAKEKKTLLPTEELVLELYPVSVELTLTQYWCKMMFWDLSHPEILVDPKADCVKMAIKVGESSEKESEEEGSFTTASSTPALVPCKGEKQEQEQEEEGQEQK